MALLAEGIAHISFRGGAAFLPARNPYDRETLIEHVTHAIRAQGRVQVLIEDQVWHVYLATDDSPATCSRCGRQVLEAACHSYGGTTAACCVKCAFASRTQPAESPADWAEEERVMTAHRTPQGPPDMMLIPGPATSSRELATRLP